MIEVAPKDLVKDLKEKLKQYIEIKAALRNEGIRNEGICAKIVGETDGRGYNPASSNLTMTSALEVGPTAASDNGL
eukprot:CAMPEP_0194343114 /NCGR_PEP_ID=MMETSP0171-20130528/95291_1 /TAXON_ID=218684 /ORGANISM="Corethron pennatum, Strain L29A3" /LENGTH=75 /DNA_ID=CAMNT_0039109135 /DNA_START=215 /DNA_END=442 /DNA_ORIENTATION=-